VKKRINIVVACGGGIFTTTVVTERIEEILKKEKIGYSVSPHKITEVPNITGADLIVVTGKTSEKNKAGAPVMIGMPLFTGVGEQEFIAEFLTACRSIQGQA
jgi:PTS system galactitol-specific IIB component